MRIHRFTGHFAAWIACLAILMASLAPSISHALAAASTAGTVWAEICSAAGLKMIEVSHGEAADPSAPTTHGLHLEDCPFCLTHANAVGLPPASIPVPLVLSSSFPLPALFYQSPRPLFVWAAPQSRAPPAHS